MDYQNLLVKLRKKLDEDYNKLLLYGEKDNELWFKYRLKLGRLIEEVVEKLRRSSKKYILEE